MCVYLEKLFQVHLAFADHLATVPEGQRVHGKYDKLRVAEADAIDMGAMCIEACRRLE